MLKMIPVFSAQTDTFYLIKANSAENTQTKMKIVKSFLKLKIAGVLHAMKIII